MTVSGCGIYWQLMDAGGSEILTIAVGGPTLEEFKDVLKAANVGGIWPPEDENEGWTIGVDIMSEHANTEETLSGFPTWARGKVRVRPAAVPG